MPTEGRIVEKLAELSVDAAFHLYRELGPGLLESVYETLLAARLERLGLKVDRQRPINIIFDGLTFERAFAADLLLNEVFLIEVKSVEKTGPVHAKQLLTYLRLMHLPLGLLINFGAPTFKEAVRRVANQHSPFRFRVFAACEATPPFFLDRPTYIDEITSVG